jgi:hypothetical protein
LLLKPCYYFSWQIFDFTPKLLSISQSESVLNLAIPLSNDL